MWYRLSFMCVLGLGNTLAALLVNNHKSGQLTQEGKYPGDRIGEKE